MVYACREIGVVMMGTDVFVYVMVCLATVITRTRSLGSVMRVNLARSGVVFQINVIYGKPYMKSINH